MISTTTVIPPQIIQRFNQMLLDPLLGNKVRVERDIIPLAKKKLRNCPGKQRKFSELLAKYYEVYERKKKEEEDYNTALKNTPKRSCSPSTGGTLRFRKFQP